MESVIEFMRLENGRWFIVLVFSAIAVLLVVAFSIDLLAPVVRRRLIAYSLAHAPVVDVPGTWIVDSPAAPIRIDGASYRISRRPVGGVCGVVYRVENIGDTACSVDARCLVAFQHGIGLSQSAGCSCSRLLLPGVQTEMLGYFHVRDGSPITLHPVWQIHRPEDEEGTE